MARKTSLKISGLEELLSTDNTEKIIRTIQDDISDVRNAYTLSDLHSLSERLSNTLVQARFAELKNTFSSEMAFREGIEERVKGDIFDQTNFVADTLFYKLNDLSFNDWLKKVHLYVRYNLDTLSSRELFDIKETVKLAYQEIKGDEKRSHETKAAKTSYKSLVSTLSYYQAHGKTEQSPKESGKLLYERNDSDVLFDEEMESSGSLNYLQDMLRKDISAFDKKRDQTRSHLMKEKVSLMQEKLLAKEQDDFEKYRRELDQKKETHETNRNSLSQKLKLEKETAKKTQRSRFRAIPKNYALVLTEHQEESISQIKEKESVPVVLSKDLSKGDYSLTRGWNEINNFGILSSANDDLELQDSAFYEDWSFENSAMGFMPSAAAVKNVPAYSSQTNVGDPSFPLTSFSAADNAQSEGTSKDFSSSKQPIIFSSEKIGKIKDYEEEVKKDFEEETAFSEESFDEKTPVDIFAFDDLMDDDASEQLSEKISEHMKGGPSEYELPRIGRADAYLPLVISKEEDISVQVKGGASEYAMPKVEAHAEIDLTKSQDIKAGLFGGASETHIPKQVSEERESLPFMRVNGELPKGISENNEQVVVPPPLPLSKKGSVQAIVPPPLPQDLVKQSKNEKNSSSTDAKQDIPSSDHIRTRLDHQSAPLEQPSSNLGRHSSSQVKSVEELFYNSPLEEVIEPNFSEGESDKGSDKETEPSLESKLNEIHFLPEAVMPFFSEYHRIIDESFDAKKLSYEHIVFARDLAAAKVGSPQKDSMVYKRKVKFDKYVSNLARKIDEKKIEEMYKELKTKSAKKETVTSEDIARYSENIRVLQSHVYESSDKMKVNAEIVVFQRKLQSMQETQVQNIQANLYGGKKDNESQNEKAGWKILAAAGGLAVLIGFGALYSTHQKNIVSPPSESPAFSIPSHVPFVKKSSDNSSSESKIEGYQAKIKGTQEFGSSSLSSQGLFYQERESEVRRPTFSLENKVSSYSLKNKSEKKLQAAENKTPNKIFAEKNPQINKTTQGNISSLTQITETYTLPKGGSLWTAAEHLYQNSLPKKGYKRGHQTMLYAMALAELGSVESKKGNKRPLVHNGLFTTVLPFEKIHAPDAKTMDDYITKHDSSLQKKFYDHLSRKKGHTNGFTAWASQKMSAMSGLFSDKVYRAVFKELKPADLQIDPRLR